MMLVIWLSMDTVYHLRLKKNIRSKIAKAMMSIMREWLSKDMMKY